MTWPITHKVAGEDKTASPVTRKAGEDPVARTIALEVFSKAHEGDRAALALVYGLMKAEGLLPVCFHDWPKAPGFDEFYKHVATPGRWLLLAYEGAAKGPLAGYALIDGFSSAGTVAWCHICCFEHGRRKISGHERLIDCAGKRLFEYLGHEAGLTDVMAALPATYHGQRRFAQRHGFLETARFDKAMRLYRQGKFRLVDMIVYRKKLT